MRQRRQSRIATSAWPPGPWRLGAVALVLISLLLPVCRANEPYPLFGPALPEIPIAIYRATPGEHAPPHYADLSAWLAGRSRLPAVNMLGGDFWLVSPLQPQQPTSDWLVTFGNTY